MVFQIKFEDVQCMYPGLYQAQVTVGDSTFGPKKSSAKKMARKLVAIAALKTLMNWEPAEGMLFDYNKFLYLKKNKKHLYYFLLLLFN